MSDICQCGSKKKSGFHAFCAPCFNRLPQRLKAVLVERAAGTNAWGAAHGEALQILKSRPARNPDGWRVAEQRGAWVVKKGPGWKVIHRAATLNQCAWHLLSLGVDWRDVSVVSKWPWLNLEDTLEAQSTQKKKQ